MNSVELKSKAENILQTFARSADPLIKIRQTDYYSQTEIIKQTKKKEKELIKEARILAKNFVDEYEIALKSTVKRLEKAANIEIEETPGFFAKMQLWLNMYINKF